MKGRKLVEKLPTLPFGKIIIPLIKKRVDSYRDLLKVIWVNKLSQWGKLKSERHSTVPKDPFTQGQIFKSSRRKTKTHAAAKNCRMKWASFQGHMKWRKTFV